MSKRERSTETEVPEILLECCVFRGPADPIGISRTYITCKLANATEVPQKYSCISACQYVLGL